MIEAEDKILVTGASGFIGARVVGSLLEKGFRNIRCLVRPTSDLARLQNAIKSAGTDRIEIHTGSLLSPDDCKRLAEEAVLIYHLAAGTGTKAFSDAFLHSVVTTRNILDSANKYGCLRRFVNVSSFAVYTNRHKPRLRLLDENCPVEKHPESRSEAYCYAKVKQDELVVAYGQKYDIPYVIVRPGSVFGPGISSIPGRVGIDTFGVFLHMGGPNRIPFSYVDNCADAIVLAGLTPGIEGEVFNIVDDDLPLSRRYLRLYKKHVKRFPSIYVPHAISYIFCVLWEYFSKWSKGQLPPVFTSREWAAFWKKTRYSNHKLKEVLGWTPKIPMDEGLRRFFESLKR